MKYFTSTSVRTLVLTVFFAVLSVFLGIHSALAVPAPNLGKIKVVILNELREPVVGASVGVNCGSGFVDAGVSTSIDGIAYIDPTSLSGANCSSGNNVQLLVTATGVPAQMFPVSDQSYGRPFFTDIDPDNIATAHDSATNVYQFGIETSGGTYDVGYWNMGGHNTAGGAFPTSDPVATTTSELASVDWNVWSTSPYPGVDDMYWYAKFTKTVTTGAGWYVFHLSSDDGSKVLVDGTEVDMRTQDGQINWQNQGYGTLASGYRNLTAGSHTIEVQYYQGDGNARLGFLFYPTIAPPPELTMTTSVYSPMNDAITSPVITVSSTILGTAVFHGSCVGTATVEPGQNSLSFTMSFADGVHDDCTLTVTDPITGHFRTFLIPSFTVANGVQTREITTCTQLQDIGANPTTYLDHLSLENSIDCTGIDFQPLYSFEGGFQGVFEGNGYEIQHLTINNENSGVGLFAQTDGATIQNLVLASGSVHGGDTVGSLIGSSYNTDIANVTSTIPVEADVTTNVGGIVGSLNYDDGLTHTVAHVSHDNTVTGPGIVGGVLGSLMLYGGGTSLTFDTVSSSGAVVGAGGTGPYFTQIGGMIGSVSVSSQNIGVAATTTLAISNSYSHSSVLGSFTNGGFIATLETTAYDYPLAVSVVSSTAAGDATSTINWAQIGGFIGYAEMGGALSDATVDFTNDSALGNVYGAGDVVGGFVGWAIEVGDNGVHQQLSFTHDIATGDVTGGSGVGGFLGSTIWEGPSITLNQSNSTGGLHIEKSYATGNVSGYYDVGGFAGYLTCWSNNPDAPHACSVNESFATGDVNGIGRLGGFTGEAQGSSLIQNAYARGAVQGGDVVGGFIGHMSDNDTVIDKAYASGPVNSGAGYGGGFVGAIDPTVSITNSFTAGAVTGDHAGGFYGTNNDSSALSGDYFDASRTSRSVCGADGAWSDGCSIVNTDSGQSTYFFGNNVNAPLNAWDFGSVWMQHNEVYPTLRLSSVQTSGNAESGSIASPLQITNCSELQNMGNGDPTGVYTLENDIDCNGVDFQPIDFGIHGFQGVFDGQGHAIHNLSINQDADMVGLFRVIDGGAVGNVSFDVTDGGAGSIQGVNWVGAVAGLTYNATLQNISSTLPVSTPGTYSFTGGLVGSAYFDDGQSNTWSNLQTSGQLMASYGAGGLAGSIELDYPGTTFSIDSATSTGNIDSSNEGTLYWAGGLVGGVTLSNDSGATTTLHMANVYTNSVISLTNGYDIGGLIGFLSANDGEGVGNIGPSEVLIEYSATHGSISSTASDNLYGMGGFIGVAFGGGDGDNEINLEHDEAHVNVVGGWSAGGFVGSVGEINTNGPYHMLVHMSDDSATGDVSGTNQIGGFLGSTEGMGPFMLLTDPGATGGLLIEHSYATGNVTGIRDPGNSNQDDEVGGFIGYLNCLSYNSDQPIACTVRQSFARGTVSSAGNDLGGFIGGGNDSTDISDSYSTGNVHQTDSGTSVGGFIGRAWNDTNTNIERSYATGAVTDCNDNCGGFVGLYASVGVLRDSFSTGAVSDGGYGGGFVGSIASDPSTLIADYFDTSSTMQTTCGQDGVTAAGCQAVNVGNATPNYFFNNTTNAPYDAGGAVWHFPDVWTTNPVSYPTLSSISQSPQETGLMSGTGVSSDPYLITNCRQLQGIQDVLNRIGPTFTYFKLNNDIDCSDTVTWNGGRGFMPLGDWDIEAPFYGLFDGDHHTISHLAIDSPDENEVGLFSVLIQSSVQNLTIVDSAIISRSNSVESSYPYGVGGIAGIMFGSVIRGVEVTSSTVMGANVVGGVVGTVWNYETPLTFDPWYSASNVLYSAAVNDDIESLGGSESVAGGVMGMLGYGVADNVYSSSTVSGINNAAGIAGYDGFASLRNSYAAGSVSSTLVSTGMEDDLGLGGLVGSVGFMDVDSSFAVARVINNSDGVPAAGGIAGAQWFIAGFADDYYDGAATGMSSCVGLASVEGCAEVNIDGMDADHFKGTNSIPPFVEVSTPWDFDKVWQLGAGYPTLKSFVAPPEVPENLLMTGDYNVTSTVTWSEPSHESEATISGYLIEIQVAGGDWSDEVTDTVDASTHSIDAGPNSILAAGTSYEVRVRAYYDAGPESAPEYGLATEPFVFTTNSEGTPPVLTVNQISAESIFNYRKERVSLTSDSAGTLSFDGGCTSTQTHIDAGTSVVELEPLTEAGAYTCTATITSDETHLSTTSNLPEITSMTPPVVSIGSCDDLQRMYFLNLDQNDGDINTVYRLSNDIDCSEYPFTSIDNGLGGFSTLLDGQGHTISNLNIYDYGQDGVGLFKDSYGGIIKDLVLNGGHVVGTTNVGALIGEGTNVVIEHVTSSISVSSDQTEDTGEYIGGLMGGVYSEGAPVVLDHVSVSGGVFGGLDIGGLVGHIYVYDGHQYDFPSSAVISNSNMSGSVQSDYACAGGLVGWTTNNDGNIDEVATVTSSRATGNVNGRYAIGGIDGCIDGPTNIFDSYATGDVSAIWGAGGLVGEFYDGSRVVRSYATGNVSGRYDVFPGDEGSFGGLVGYMSTDVSSTAPSISQSYALGNVDAQSYEGVGGLVGYLYRGAIADSFAHGSVTGTYSVGGLVGELDGAGDRNSFITHSYAANGTVTGQSYGEITNPSDVGGLVGSIRRGSITHSFSADRVQGDAVNQGGLIGSSLFPGYGTGTDTEFDGDRSQHTDCVGNSIASFDCSRVNADGESGGYLFDQANAPLNSFDTQVWAFSGEDYPELIGLPSLVDESTDRTSPAAVTDVTSQLLPGGHASISWSVPADMDFSSTIIRSRQYDPDYDGDVTFPFSVYDGYVIDSQNTGSVSTDPAQTEDALYAYGLFAVDTHGNTSQIATTTLRVWNYPIVTTGDATDITTSSTVLSGHVSIPGGTTVIDAGYYIGLEGGEGYTITQHVASPSAGDFNVQVGPLMCGTSYVYQAFAINEHGERDSYQGGFTTSACGDLVISSLEATSIATSTATIVWTTDRAASSRVTFSPDKSFTSLTDISQDDPRVTEHTVVVSGIKPCTKYAYEAVSDDGAGYVTTSTDSSFTTRGCSGDAEPTTDGTQTVNTGEPTITSLTDRANTIDVATPANFTATTSQIIIQIQGLSSHTVLGAIGTPSSNLISGASVVFNVQALIDAQTTLDSFDLPVTITYHYSAADVAGLVEGSLTMYHYHNGAWIALDDCRVDTNAKTITCTTPNFSTFAIFGASAPVSGGGGRGGGGVGGGGSVTFGCKDPLALNYNAYAQSNPLLCRYTPTTMASVTTTAVGPSVTFLMPVPTTQLACTASFTLKHAIRFGAKNDPADVKLLEKYLNTYESAHLPIDGVYSKAGRDAVIAWQEKYASEILKPWGLKKGTGYVFTTSLKKMQQIRAGICSTQSSSKSITPTPQTSSAASSTGVFTKNLKQGDTGADVKRLQVYLNTHGYPLAVSGPGSSGKETTTFGPTLVKALIRFQQDHADVLLTPFKFTRGTGMFYDATRKLINGMIQR